MLNNIAKITCDVDSRPDLEQKVVIFMSEAGQKRAGLSMVALQSVKTV